MKKINAGFSVIEILVAIGIFAVLATAVVPSIIQTFTIARLGDNETDATFYTQEGIEAARSIKNQAWANLTDGSYGLATGSGVWAFLGTNNTKGIYTRTETVSDIYRDISGNMQLSGCTNMLDKNAKRVVATNNWNSSPTRTNNVTLETYFTNWKKTAFGNWALPSQEGSLDLAGNQRGIKVKTQLSYAYLVRTSGTPDFAIADISTSTPTLTGNLSLGGGATNVFVLGRYVYVSAGNTLQIIDACTPSTPTVVGTFTASGIGIINSLYVVGSTAYLVRASGGGGNEFVAVNVSTPSSPTLLGSLSLSTTANDVTVMGNFAYVASTGNSNELQVVNVTTPSTPTIAGTLNLAGNNDATAIAGFDSEVVIGRIGGDVDVISVSTPSAPTLLGTYSAGSDINNISLGNANLYAFVAVAGGSNQLRIVDIHTPATPTLVGQFSYSAAINGVSYSSFNDRVYGATSNNAQELASFKPS